MTDTEPREIDGKIVEKIRKILAKAEGTTNEAEAETFYAAATDLMQKYAVDLALVTAAGKNAEDTIDHVSISFGSTYWMAWRLVASIVGDAFGFKTLLIDNGKNGHLEWIGWRSELQLAEVIWTSILIQAERAANQHMRDYPISDREDRFREKRSFIQGFGSRVGQRIKVQRESTLLAESRKHSGDASGSLLPVLVDRGSRLDSYWSDILATTKKVKLGGQIKPGAYAAGTRAGDRADISNPKVQGSRGRLSS